MGSRNAFKGDFLELIELVKHKNLPIQKIVTNVYSLSDATKAFTDFDSEADKMLKVIINFTN